MLILRREAEQDIKDIYEWYEEQRLNLGVAFIAEVESIFKTIEYNLKLYAKVIKDVRRALCKRFPYSIYFIEARNEIVVLGVLHQRRNPAVWQSRK